MPHMLGSLSRISISASCILEVRLTALAAADAVLAWELMKKKKMASKFGDAAFDTSRQSESSEKYSGIAGTKRALDDMCEQSSENAVKFSRNTEGLPVASRYREVTSETKSSDEAGNSNAIGEREDEFSLNPSMVQLLATFLVRQGMIATESTDASHNKLFPRCVALFEKLVDVHPLVHIVKFSAHFERIIFQQRLMSQEKVSYSKADNSGAQASSAALTNKSLAAFGTFLLCAFKSPLPGVGDISKSGFAQHTISAALASNIMTAKEMLLLMAANSSTRVQKIITMIVLKVTR